MGIDGIAEAIKDKKNRKFLISSHLNMEGDAIGSMLAMAELLKKAGKKVILLPPEGMPQVYKFLPGAYRVKPKRRIRHIDYDIACLVDCTDIERIGGMKKAVSPTKPILNIDHHVSNSFFGSVNWVDSNVSCSGEQIYHLFKKMKIPLNKNAALYIYIAILTDTGSFRYSNTTADTHKIVAELMRHGIDPTDIYRRIYEGIRKPNLALLASVLSTLDTSKNGAVAWIYVSAGMLKRYGVDIDDTQDFVNFPRSIKGVKIALAFRQIGKNLVKVSMRSNGGVDVNRLAVQFNGGGHVSASGCTLKGTLKSVVKTVTARAETYLRANSRH